MRTPASIKSHPLHPILVAFPIGLLTFSLFSDIVLLAGWGGAAWSATALYTLAAGIVTALVAAVPGLVDLLSLTDRNEKNKAMTHMLIMLAAVAIFAADFFVRYFWLRRVGADVAERYQYLPVALSALGVVVMVAGGWIGAELVHKYGITVDERALRRTGTITAGPVHDHAIEDEEHHHSLH